MAISKRLRFEILRRDNFQCRYCGAKPPEAELHVDHVVPKALGGDEQPSNLVTACEPCNSGKTSTTPDAPLVEDVKSDALRWARAMEVALEVHRAKRDERDAYVNYFSSLWAEWTYDFQKKPIPLDPDWRSTVEKFFSYGLDPDDLAHAVRTAMENRKVLPAHSFRYFCGICWNTLRDLREMAADIVTTEIDDEVNGGW